jgi:hypothetical protein
MDAGPLTTTFTPPPACQSSLSSVYSLSGSSFFIAGPADPSGGCFPRGYAGSLAQYYSPGVCPAGYTVACASLLSVGAATETVATCCPSAYACDTSLPGFLAAQAGDAVFACESVFTLTTNVVGLDPGDYTPYTTLVGSVLGDGNAFNAFGVQIRFQAASVRFYPFF